MLIYQQSYVQEKQPSSMEKSTVEDRQMTGTLSTAMTHLKTTGPLYHHFLSDCLVWVKPTEN